MRDERRRRTFILAVDDDPSIHDAYELIFGQEHEFLGVCDGSKALDVLRSRPADVVLLDLRMPGLDGLALLQCIREVRPEAKVIVVSVVDQVRPGLASLRLGALDYVTKPFDEEHLTRLVRRVIAQGSAVVPRVADPKPSPCVLIAGGSPGIRAALSVALSLRCEVRIAPSVAAACREIAQYPPDLIIATAVGDDCEAALASMRASSPGAPILLIASQAERVSIARGGVLHGVHAVFQTPPDVGRLLHKAIRSVARHAGTELKGFSRVSTSVIDYVAARYAEASVEEIASTVRLSPSYVSRAFRDDVGLSPWDYVTRVRLEVAKFMLRETRDKVETIAAMVGLCDAPHLARLLRRHDHHAPRDYRQGKPAD